MLDDHEELIRVRTRQHDFQAEVGGLRLMLAEFVKVPEQLAQLRVEMRDVAKNVAEDAIELALERRNEDFANRARDRRDRFRSFAQYVAVALGGAGVLFTALTFLNGGSP